VDEVIRKYDPSNPSASVAGLLKVREALQKLPEVGFWKQEKLAANRQLLQACMGLFLEATATAPLVVAGQPTKVTLEMLNQQADYNRKVAGTHIQAVSFGQADSTMRLMLYPNEKQALTKRVTFPSSLTSSQPYWLVQPGSIGMYPVVEQKQRSKGENEPAASVKVRLQIVTAPSSLNPTADTVTFAVPVQYKSTDPVEGEKYRPLTVVPPVMVNVGGHAYVFADNQPKNIPVTLRAGKAGVKGTLALTLPAGWKAEPASIPFELAAKDAEQTVQFRVQPGAGAAEGKAELRAVANVDGQSYSRGYQVIAYTHIPTQTLFPEAVAPLVKLDLKRKGQEIGYLMGAGDEVPDALRQIGYTVTLLKPEDLSEQNLRRFDAVVLGVRAYNTVDRLKTLQPTLLKYVENGGNLVVQYNTSRSTVLPQVGPYPLTLSNDRVTVENAPVTFLNPTQPLLNTPNKITGKDFEGWQQEQGLYYPSAWDPKYQTVISSQDPGEKAKESAILVADYGKGHYIYTGLSFFRELPAGVPGAYRLLTNIVSLGR
jgi:NPCBM-associated, NEW3 domain of alpha-galactosidase